MSETTSKITINAQTTTNWHIPPFTERRGCVLRETQTRLIEGLKYLFFNYYRKGRYGLYIFYLNLTFWISQRNAICGVLALIGVTFPFLLIKADTGHLWGKIKFEQNSEQIGVIDLCTKEDCKLKQRGCKFTSDGKADRNYGICEDFK